MQLTALMRLSNSGIHKLQPPLDYWQRWGFEVIKKSELLSQKHRQRKDTYHICISWPKITSRHTTVTCKTFFKVKHVMQNLHTLYFYRRCQNYFYMFRKIEKRESTMLAWPAGKRQGHLVIYCNVQFKKKLCDVCEI